MSTLPREAKGDHQRHDSKKKHEAGVDFAGLVVGRAQRVLHLSRGMSTSAQACHDLQATNSVCSSYNDCGIGSRATLITQTTLVLMIRDRQWQIDVEKMRIAGVYTTQQGKKGLGEALSVCREIANALAGESK